MNLTVRLVVGAIVLTTVGCATRAASSAGSGTGGGVYQPGNGVSYPQVVREVKPRYPLAALRARITGIVLIEAVVLPDGSVGDVRVVRSIDRGRDLGLDDAAVEAAKRWRFRPGTRFGEPVAVLVTIELSFAID